MALLLNTQPPLAFTEERQRTFGFIKLNPTDAQRWRDTYAHRKANSPDPAVNMLGDVEMAFVKTELLNKIIREVTPTHLVFRFGCERPTNSFRNLEVYVCGMNKATPPAGEVPLGGKVYKCSQGFNTAPGAGAPVDSGFTNADLFFQARNAKLGIYEPRGIAFEVPAIQATGVLGKLVWVLYMGHSDYPGQLHNTVIAQGLGSPKEIVPRFVAGMEMYDHGSQCCPIGR